MPESASRHSRLAREASPSREEPARQPFTTAYRGPPATPRTHHHKTLAWRRSQEALSVRTAQPHRTRTNSMSATGDQNVTINMVKFSARMLETVPASPLTDSPLSSGDESQDERNSLKSIGTDFHYTSFRLPLPHLERQPSDSSATSSSPSVEPLNATDTERVDYRLSSIPPPADIASTRTTSRESSVESGETRVSTSSASVTVLSFEDIEDTGTVALNKLENDGDSWPKSGIYQLVNEDDGLAMELSSNESAPVVGKTGKPIPQQKWEVTPIGQCYHIRSVADKRYLSVQAGAHPGVGLITSGSRVPWRVEPTETSGVYCVYWSGKQLSVGMKHSNTLRRLYRGAASEHVHDEYIELFSDNSRPRNRWRFVPC